MPLSSLGASNIGSRLLGRLIVYVEDNGLGIVTGEQGGYRLDPAHPEETELGPDVAFVRADRAPSPTSPDYYKKAPLLAPDLAVEVASENQYAPSMAAKAQMYLTFGTRLVWVIWPRYKRVDVWHPATTRRHRLVLQTRSTARTWYRGLPTPSFASSLSSIPGYYSDILASKGELDMPRSENRRQIEIPRHLYDELEAEAKAEGQASLTSSNSTSITAACTATP
jgi:Uma2 family endonuclease